MPDTPNRLLEAEEAVNNVLDELTKLQQVASGHASAKASLEEVRNDLRAMVQRTAQTAEQSGRILARLNELSVPEMLHKTTLLRADVENLARVLPQSMTETGTNVRADLRKTAADLQAHAKDRLSEFLAAAEKVAADLTTRTAGSLDGMAGSVKDSMKAVQQATDRGLAELQREQADLFGKQLADQREHFEHLASQQRDLFADVSGGFRKLLDDSIEQTQAVHTSEAAKLGEQLTQQRAYFDQQLKRQDDRFEQVSDRVRALLDESITRSQSLQQQLAENLIARMEQEAERRSKATIDLFAEAARGLDRQIEAKVVASESQLKDISSAAQAAIGARVDGCRQEAAAATARANAACGDLAALRTAMKTQFWVLAGVGLVVLATLALAVLHGNR